MRHAGLPSKSIAFDPEIGPGTVEVHRANVMAQDAGEKRVPQLVQMALAAGFRPDHIA